MSERIPATHTGQTPRCEVCLRRAGMADAHLNRFGEADLSPDAPVGPLSFCRYCQRLTCPDCQHERDCCELDGEVQT